MGMGENRGIKPADILSQTLQPELGRGVHDELGLSGGDVDRGTGSMVLGVGQKFRRIIACDERHTL